MTAWLTVEEALRRFGMSRATLYRLISVGKVARAKRAGDVRAYVSLDDLKRVTALQPTPARRKSER